MSLPPSADKPVPRDSPPLERLVDDFEEAWQGGSVPFLSDFLPPLSADGSVPDERARRQLLEELIKVDLEYRWRRARAMLESTPVDTRSEEAETRSPANPGGLPRRPLLEDYVARFSELGSLRELSVELIGEEYRVRRQWGDRPDHTEYLTRFTEHGVPLKDAFARIDTEMAAELQEGKGLILTNRPSIDTPVLCPSCQSPVESITCPACRQSLAAGLWSAKPASETESVRRSQQHPGSSDWPLVPGYEIVRELGRGGMGVVYEAHQRRLDRTVALKVIRTGLQASPDELARFRTEAEAVARLQHPHIVQIYETGEEVGSPYFSLEYLQDGTLAQQLGGTPQPARNAAQMVETLARAMHSAHQHGIVHRDLKPANVLLQCLGSAEAPEERRASMTAGIPLRSSTSSAVKHFIPKISDFGLAKRLDKEIGLTQTGAIMGTPSYMAPEQAAGKTRAIGPLADIYSLGAILYEMLTGRPPFKGETTLDTIQQVLSEEPVPPAQLQPKLPRDLQTICLKCLQKSPGSRYPSAEALADDLRRFLAGEPIIARPVGVWERTLKWARRRPALAALILVSSLATLTLVLGGLWYNTQLREALETAEQRQQEAQRERARAEADFQKARDAVDAMLTEVGGKQLAQVPQMEPVRRALLEKALQFYQGFLQEKSTDPVVRRETARAYDRTAAIYEWLGRRAQAEEPLHQALHLDEQLAAEFPDEPAYRQDEAAVYVSLGNLYRVIGQPAQAEDAYHKALDLHEQLVQNYPGVAPYEHKRAISYLNLGVFHAEQGHADKAETYLLKALAACEKLYRAQPDAPEYEKELAESHTNLGNLYLSTGRAAEAEAAYRKGLGPLEHLAHTHPTDPHYQSLLAAAHNNLGFLLAATQRPAEAKTAFQKAINLREALIRDYPHVSDFAVDLGGSYLNLANLVRDTGNPHAALEGYTRAVRTLETQLQKQPRDKVVRQRVRDAYMGRAEAYSRLAQHLEAVQDWDRALAVDDGSGHNELILYRALAVARSGDHRQATAAVKALVEKPAASGLLFYNAACVYSLSAAAARRDPKFSPVEAGKQAELYASRAIQLLAKAEAAGFFKNPAMVEDVKKDSDLDAISARDDFEKWLAALQAKTKRGDK
jgi:serine/threonine protein kinase/Tfp pilus assembly protein PilF